MSKVRLGDGAKGLEERGTYLLEGPECVCSVAYSSSRIGYLASDQLTLLRARPPTKRGWTVQRVVGVVDTTCRMGTGRVADTDLRLFTNRSHGKKATE